MELYVKTREEWRHWLEENYMTFNEIWLIYYKKPSGKPRIAYEDAVEEALCFGWIDGKIRKINEDYFIQRFTPRKLRSRWSKYNIDRVRKLMGKGLMRPEGLLAFQKALDNPGLIYSGSADGDLEIPADLEEAFKGNDIAYKNFLKFSNSNRRLYISWLIDAKRAVTRKLRIVKIIENSEKNLRPGMI